MAESLKREGTLLLKGSASTAGHSYGGDQIIYEFHLPGWGPNAILRESPQASSKRGNKKASKHRKYAESGCKARASLIG